MVDTQAYTPVISRSDRTSSDAVAHDCCHESGYLICKDAGYVLRRLDGQEIWLEMDMIPLHLVDVAVEIDGTRYSSNFMLVQSIGPVDKH